MSVRQAQCNPFLTAPPGRLFLANAAPIVVVMVMSGLLSVVDAILLGLFIGAPAVAAVSLAFPVVMLTIALSTLVGSGMSSLYARALGAGDRAAAAEVFASAHGLALVLSLGLIVFVALFGTTLVDLMAGPDRAVAAMTLSFVRITLFATPIQFLLALHVDALRNEGRAALLAPLSIGLTLLNGALTYGLIGLFDFGIAGSALGTAAAQGIALLLVALLRRRQMPLGAPANPSWTRGWPRIFALGAPVSLSFIGMAFVAVCMITALRSHGGAGYVTTMAAYGIVTRLIGLAFLPMMGMALAMQNARRKHCAPNRPPAAWQSATPRRWNRWPGQLAPAIGTRCTPVSPKRPPPPFGPASELQGSISDSPFRAGFSPSRRRAAGSSPCTCASTARSMSSPSQASRTCADISAAR